MLPRTVQWMQDTDDDGDYRFFAATDSEGTFLGASAIDVGRMGFGPLADITVGFLEDICVVEEHRRKGAGAALLRATLKHAWECGCEHVRCTVEYANDAGIALYRSVGMGVIPEEDPQDETPVKCYTVISLNPERERGEPERKV
jgi:ribosomal protein S18 acetylase RimI-like enzyme